MAKLTFTVSAARKELIEADCKIRGVSLDERFEGYFKDVESSAGFDHTEADPAEIEGSVTRAKNKATRAQNLRDAATRQAAEVPAI